MGNAVDSLQRYLAMNDRKMLESIHRIGFHVEDFDSEYSTESEPSESESLKPKCNPIDELRAIIEHYSNLDFDLGRPIIISLSNIVDHRTSMTVQAMLLKFIEETQHRIIILTRNDDVLPAILSRAGAIIKKPSLSSYSFSDAFEARSEMEYDNKGIRMLGVQYAEERMKRSVEMSRVDLLCFNNHKGKGFKSRVAYILEHK